MEIPKICVGMPVFNGETTLEESIRSVLAQTYDDFELIIADNASTDGTEEICRDYAVRDCRIRYVRNPVNIGAAANYNMLFDMAHAPFFRWSNADDLIAPRAHELCLRKLEENPDAVLAYGKTTIIDEHGEKINTYDDNLNLDQEAPVERFKAYFQRVGMTNVIYGLMRSEALRYTSLMGNGKIPAADTKFMAELAIQGKFLEIDTPLFYRRIHNQASSWDRQDEIKQRMFWSAGRKRFTLPRWRVHLGYLSAVSRAPVGRSERIRLVGQVMRGMYIDKRRLVTELIPGVH